MIFLCLKLWVRSTCLRSTITPVFLPPEKGDSRSLFFDLKNRFTNGDSKPIDSTQREFCKLKYDEIDRCAKVIKLLGIKPL
jgi:hypothetical protein